jgi:predicted CxxxxCH...CXXCH cytochrome family protein
MSSIKPSHLLISMALAFALGGCGDKNDKAVFSPESGHPSDWTATHKTAAQADPESCMECHGANLDDPQGGIAQRPCTKCHIGGVPIGPNAGIGCASCHNVPPNGSAFPNRKLSHDKHVNLPGVTCNTCHNGFGSGTPGHGTLPSARLSPIDSVFKAKQAPPDVSPTYSRDASGGVTCTNVSCHGGKPTPVWGSGIIDCTSCHEQGTLIKQDTAPRIVVIPEYNSFYSGYSNVGLTDTLGATLNATFGTTLGTAMGTNQHARHLHSSRGATCRDCHDIWKLTNQHFGGIVSKTFVSPGNTIGGGSTSIGSYDPANQTCSIVTCHGDTPSSTIKWPWYRF